MRAAATALALVAYGLMSPYVLYTEAHEYMHEPPARTGSCLLNGVIMGGAICQTLTVRAAGGV